MKNCLLLINPKSVRFSICASLLIAAGVSWLNAGSIVPDEWNVAPMQDGAYLESFEGALPAWATLTGASVLTNLNPEMTDSGLPTRSNAWFTAHTKVLALDTEGTVISNKLQNSNEEPVSFVSAPVYVDMRVRFEPMAKDPDATSLANCKLAFYANNEFKLVVAGSGGCRTNATVLDMDKWHQITVKMLGGLCNVYRNDQLTFENITLNNAGGANQLDTLSFKGGGCVDELYVSRGAPDYAVVGPSTAIPSLPIDGDNVPTDQQQTRINKYLSDQSGLTGLSMSQDALSAAYLADAPLTGAAAAAPAVNFGISKIDIITATSLKITTRLAIDSTAKAGDINGRIQLQGKINKGDSWSVLAGAVTPGSVSFTNGEVTFTYNIPSDGYKFFKCQIIPKEI